MTNSPHQHAPDAGRYLDSGASRPLRTEARETWEAAVERGWADPRALHGAGRDARLLWHKAREVTAEAFGVHPEEVSFTSSGTEAVHRGLLGLLHGRRRAPHRVGVTAVEHSSVLHAIEWSGWDARPIGVERTGRVLPQECDPTEVSVVACQGANHEVGTLQPVEELADRLAGEGVPVFSDLCAMAGQAPLPRGWDVAAASAHKWGGPAGVGVLLVRRRARWRNPFPADDRIDERTAGFENVPAILAAAAALRASLEESAADAARQRELVDRLRGRLVERVDDVEVVGDPVHRLPHLLTFSCLYIDGEVLVHALQRRGYAVASGSACSAATLRPSHVLEAMGVLTHGNVRVAVNAATTAQDVDGFVDAVAEVVDRLRREAGL